MRTPSKRYIESLRKRYPAGTRVALVQIDDKQAPPVGTKGTVLWVDDIGSLIMKWDNGSGLNVVLEGGDRVRILDSVTVVCYGETETWEDREEAKQFYLQAIAGTEGSERERNTNIYCALCDGAKICKDGVDE